MTIPTWIPDWRNQDVYPGEDTTNYQFAWEFLRRNINYQEFYAEHGFMWKHTDTISQDIQNLFGLDAQSALIDPASPEPYATVYSGGESIKTANMKVNFALLFKGEDPTILNGGNDRVIRNFRLNDSQVLVTFDLSADLKPQIKKIERSLAGSANKSAPKRKKKAFLYTRYLRILDADARNIPPIEVFDTLFPDKKSKSDKHKRGSISDKLDAAENLVIDGYQHLGLGAFSGTIPNRTFIILKGRK